MTTRPIDTEALIELADAATPGPWEAFGTTIAAWGDTGDCGGCSGILSPAHEPSCYLSEIAGAGEANAEFIAAARTAVPALLDALEVHEDALEERAASATYWESEYAAAEHRATHAEAEVKRLSWKVGHLVDKYDADMEELRRENEEELAEEMALRMNAVAAATEAEARIKAVEDVLDRWQIGGYDALLRRLRRALDGDA